MSPDLQAEASQPTAAQTYARLLAYSRPHLAAFSLGVLGMIVFAATDTALAWCIKYFLQDAFV
jgi:hypothetical protein